jgi:hypothetical protein
MSRLPWEAPAFANATPLPWEAAKPANADIAERVKAIAGSTEYRKFLKIRPREGGARIPFVLNPAQTALDESLNAELREFGRVRALIPKARRMGVSTYIGARYFQKTATQKGRRAHVVAHRNDSATNLHREIKEFYKGLPDPWKPSLGASNARELLFDILQSAYKVSSAEGGDIGRSDDTHLLHMSEAAFFDNTADLSSGLLQTVLDQPDTEIAMESTGNGPSGMFFSMCEQAHREQNRGLWRLHFLPWTLMHDYQELVPIGWKAPQEFIDYARLHGLTPPQLYWFWRRNYDLATMNGGQPDVIHRLTRQEYPIIYSECFSTDSSLDFFKASLIRQAMLSVPQPSIGALKIMSVDPSGDGKDSCFVCDRQGSAIGSRIWGEIKSNDTNVQADWIVENFRRYQMDVIVIETDGVGKGLLDAVRLRMKSAAYKVVALNRASGAHNRVQFGNRRAEVHFKFSLALEGVCSLPNDKRLEEEAATFKWGLGGCRRDELARLFITPKEKIRAELGRSCDCLDAVVNSYAVNDYEEIKPNA